MRWARAWGTVALVAVGLGGPALAMSGCFSMRGSRGGGTEAPPAGRAIGSGTPGRVSHREGGQWPDVSNGGRLRCRGKAYVLEGGFAYGDAIPAAATPEGARRGVREVAAGGERDGPWNGVDHSTAPFSRRGGDAEGRALAPGGGREGEPQILVAGLPSRGDHHTNGPVVRDGWVYFGQGTATNAAVVGEDNAAFGWLPGPRSSGTCPARTSPWRA